MRIGNWLGGSVIMTLATIHGMAATARTAEHVTTVPTWEVPWMASPAIITSASTFRRDSEACSRSKRQPGRSPSSKVPNGTPLANGQDIGFDQQGWYTFKVEGAKKPYSVENTFVQVGESTKKPWNFYYWPTKGDSIHEPWAGGNARVDTMNVTPGSDDQLIAAPGGYIPPGIDIVLPGPNGLLETLPQAGDDATWFPNIYDDLTWVGPDKNNGGEITRFRRLPPCSSTTSSSEPQPASGRRRSARTRISRAGPATALEVPSPPSS